MKNYHHGWSGKKETHHLSQKKKNKMSQWRDKAFLQPHLSERLLSSVLCPEDVRNRGHINHAPFVSMGPSIKTSV